MMKEQRAERRLRFIMEAESIVNDGACASAASRSIDHLVELTLTVLAAYGSFALAEKLHVSGVLAALAAGMTVGNWGRGRFLTQRGSEAIIRFWDFAAFLANSIIFLLIGSRAAQQPFGAYLLPAFVGTVLALAGRAAAVYPLSALYVRSKLAINGMTRHLLFWVAFGEPWHWRSRWRLPRASQSMMRWLAQPLRSSPSIFVHGLTVPWLLRRSGLLAKPE